MTAPIFFLAPNAELSGSLGKEISLVIAQANAAEPVLMGLSHGASGYINRFDLSKEEFKECLTVYENNQEYFHVKGLKDKLQRLEGWFIRVIEPRPKRPGRLSRDDRIELQQEIDDWFTREIEKPTNGYSPYCDPRVRKEIKLEREVLKQVRANSDVIFRAQKRL